MVMTGCNGRGALGAVVGGLGGLLGGLFVVATVLATQSRADTGPLGELIDAAAQRLQTAEPVAAFKWNAHGSSEIEDPARVQQVLARVRADAGAQHVDPDYVARVFSDQINATEGVEYSRFADWKLDPASAPTTAPDLSASRSAIDALNQAMVTQIVVNWNLLHSPDCAAQLDEARSGVAQARQLDSLYQQALALATRSYCA